MKNLVICLSILFSVACSAFPATLYIEGSYERGADPLPDGPGTVQLDVYVEGLNDVVFVAVYFQFSDGTGADVSNFTIKNDQQTGNPDFGDYCVTLNTQKFPTLEEHTATARKVQFSVSSPADFTEKTLAMSILYDYDAYASGPYIVGSYTVATKPTIVGTTTAPTGTPISIIKGRIDIGSSLRIIYVDDDAPNDPGPGDPGYSDPLEDGTADHPFDAIQEAIDAAATGDIIIVKDGTFSGDGNRDITLDGKAILLTSENGPANCTIAPEGTSYEMHRGFCLDSGESAACVINGFTITGGFANRSTGSYWILGSGGGIVCYGSSPTITNCILVENSAANYGGAIHCQFGSPCIVGNVISSNASSGGGGISLSCTSASIVSSNTITGNTATGCNAAWGDAEGGGAVLVVAGADYIFDNVISSNAASYGGGIYAMLSYLKAERNIIISNNRPNPGWWSSGGGVAA
ncbi:MAG TPA: right-handed parallel beta-helix repeat-containing protein, partial [Pirellulales bacterium]|nr:right-handed parallel beta-helix repeat-containing protein [Pirellulales bacterium]